MANQNKSSLTASRTVPLVLQYLKEQGFEETFQALQLETGVEYDKVEPNKPAQLMEALTVWDDARSKADAKGQEISPEQRADEQLVLSQSEASAAKGGSGGNGAAGGLWKSLDAVHKLNVIACRFHPDPMQSLMASGGADKLLKVTDYTTATVVSSADCKGPVLTLDFNPKWPQLLAVGCMNNTHRVVQWSAAAQQMQTLQDFKDHQKYVVAIRWSGDGKFFATASHDKTVNVYEPDDGAAPAPAPVAAAANDAKAAPVAAAPAVAAAGAGAAAVAAAPAGGAASAAPRAWRLRKTFPFLGAVECITWLRDNHTLLVGVRNDSYLHAVNVMSFVETAKYNTNARDDDHVSFTALDLVLSPDGGLLAVPTDGHRVIVFRTGTNRQVRNLYGFTADGFSNPRVAWSRDGAYVYATSQDLNVVVWELATAKVVRKLSGHTNVVRDIAIHPARELVLTCGFDKSLKLWQPNAAAGAGAGKTTGK